MPYNLKPFYKSGFVKIPGFIPEQLLQKLRELFNELMDTSSPLGKVIIQHNGHKYVTNMEEICCKGNLAALELLGYPPLLEMANSICGDDFFMIQEFAVIKNIGDNMPVLWHQDMVHERKGNCFTIGFYLDDVNEGDGALKVVPGSHLSGKHICELARETYIEIAAKAGDVLIHDMMLAHSSDPLQKNSVRRVIYFEFLSAAHVRTENIYTDELINRRTRLLFAASKYYGLVHPEGEKFVYRQHNPFDDSQSSLQKILEEIYLLPVQARPSTYCLKNGYAVFG